MIELLASGFKITQALGPQQVYSIHKVSSQGGSHVQLCKLEYALGIPYHS